eukprot:TRINITY_DN20786_c0_g1_i1.p1 TRINITY_DN20786_c0_g1~~TRINITY_DN20786_c0_g1_i1.p1  ORF type:complete len:110 (+),score=18.01 TRINITY_DN20786_c0_g1_i1:157-486(+)
MNQLSESHRVSSSDNSAFLNIFRLQSSDKHSQNLLSGSSDLSKSVGDNPRPGSRLSSSFTRVDLFNNKLDTRVGSSHRDQVIEGFLNMRFPFFSPYCSLRDCSTSLRPS